MTKLTTLFSGLATAIAVSGCIAPRSDTVDLRKVDSAAPEEKAATCIKENLFPNNPYIRVAKDGLTVSFSRLEPGSYTDKPMMGDNAIEVSVFNNRGISDPGAQAFTVLAFGDDNDKNMVAVMENCIYEAMPEAMNYELQPPLPAPPGYKSLPQLTNKHG